MNYGFTKNDRSSFKYWFAHWCAYQMVALNCHQWKFKYLFHDWYKPWMKLFTTYDKVQMFHNKHSSHHLLKWFLIPITDEYKMDWDGMIIDWECSRFTKQASPLTAKDELSRIINSLKTRDENNKTVKQLIKLNILGRSNISGYSHYMKKINIANKQLQKSLEKLGLS